MTQLFTNQGLGLTGSSIYSLGSFGPKGSARLGQGKSTVFVNAATGNLVMRQQDGFLASAGLGLDLIHTYNSRAESGQNWCFNVQSRLIIQSQANQIDSLVTRIDEDGHHRLFLFDQEKGCYVSKEGGFATLRFANDHWVFSEGTGSFTQEYNEAGFLIAYRDRDNHRFQFIYQDGQLTAIHDTNGQQRIEWSFQKGLLQEITTFSQGKVIHRLSYTYDAYHRLQKLSRDLGGSKTYWISYDYVGDSTRLSGIRQSDGTALFIDYDSEGRVRHLLDGEGRTTSYDYDLGKTIVSNALGEAWVYLYNEEGLLTSVEGPNHSFCRYEYQGSKLIAIHQGQLHWYFNYNEYGDCTRTEEPSGQIIERLYDNEHHLLCEKRFDGPGKSKINRWVYDERGHLRFKVSAEGTVTEYRYNNTGQCLSSRTYLRACFLLEEERIRLGVIEAWLAQQNQQDLSLKEYAYDWRGLLAKEMSYTHIGLDGKGDLASAIQTYYQYDAVGKMVEKSVVLTKGLSTTHYLYDDLGRLIQTWDNEHRGERFDYDDEHQCIITTDAKGLQQIRIFDRSGLLLSLQSFDSQKHDFGTISYRYDAAGRLVSEQNADGSSHYYFYDNEGRLIAQCEPNGQVIEYRYDEQSRLIQTRHYANTVATKGWKDCLPL